MNKLREPNLIAGIIASIVFLLLFIGLKWNVFISLIMAAGVFLGVYYLTKPIVKIGDIELTQIADGIEINNIYLDAKQTLFEIHENSQLIENPTINEKAQSLAGIGNDIIRYLENNPRQISQSRHFLTYYIPTADTIIDNYLHLKKANVSADKFQLITERTEESLDLLNKVFANQRDGYHKDKLLALEVQTELLEKTITLGGKER